VGRDYTAIVKRGLLISAALAVVFLVLAALGLDAPVAFLALLALALNLLGLLLALALRRWPSLRLRAARAGLWLATLILAAGIFVLQHEATQSRGAQVVAALEVYRTRHGSYPESIEALAPAFLPRIPPASDRVLGGSAFRYRRQDDGFTLGYSGPALLYREYDSRTRAWTTRD